MEESTSKDEASLRGTAPSVEALEDELPSYQIEEVLAYGGMGTVYAGQHRALERRVAVKVLPSRDTVDADVDYEALFVKEARAMAKLSHPGIVQVHDFGITRSGWLYLVMELVDGMNVEQMLVHQGRAFSAAEAGAIGLHVADALIYAHEHGVVHGDVKPANLLIDHEGKVHLADLGLARGWQESAENSLGTPGYAAPELFDPEATVDIRTDVYALGATLFEMMTGKTPTAAGQSPLELAPEVGHRWDALVRKATRHDADARYQTMQEMRQALERLVTPPAPAGKKERATKPPLPMDRRPLIGEEALPILMPRPKRKPYGWILAAIIVAAAAIAGLKWRKDQANTLTPTTEDVDAMMMPKAE